MLRRDGTVFSATETLRGELANADHLGVLGAIWYDLTRRSQTVRFETSLRDTLPPAEADAALADPACTWLWRSLREAESAGLDAGEVLRDAVAVSSLTGAQHVARVIDARVRRMLDGRVPQLPESWSQRVPEVADPELRRYLTDLAAAMDDRVRRLGEHAVQTQPGWAIEALGDMPDDPTIRSIWEGRAAQLSAYRELYGYDSETDAIGPEPGKSSPEARADWHAAFAALGRVEGIDLRGCTDDQLRLRRRCTSGKPAGHRRTSPRNSGWPGCRLAPRGRTLSGRSMKRGPRLILQPSLAISSPPRCRPCRPKRPGSPTNSRPSTRHGSSGKP